MKKIILKMFFLVNVLMFAMYLLVLLAAIFEANNLLRYFASDSFSNIRVMIALPVMILWVYTLIAWSRFDKNIGRFLMLFFLIGLYSPFYYLKMVKNNWI